MHAGDHTTGRNCSGHNGNGNEYYHKPCCLSRSTEDGHGAAELLCCCCTCTATASPSLLTSLGVCIFVLAYTLVGAFTFMAVEGGLQSVSTLTSSNINRTLIIIKSLVLKSFKRSNTIFLNISIQSSSSSSSSSSSIVSSKPGQDETAALGAEIRSRTVEKLWSITEDLNILYKDNWTRLAAQEVLDFQNILVHSLRKQSYQVIPATTNQHRGRHHRWTFSSSLLYSLTLITTTGEFIFPYLLFISFCFLLPEFESFFSYESKHPVYPSTPITTKAISR